MTSCHGYGYARCSEPAVRLGWCKAHLRQAALDVATAAVLAERDGQIQRTLLRILVEDDANKYLSTAELRIKAEAEEKTRLDELREAHR